MNKTYLTPVGFEPTQLALVELESTPLDHSGKLSLAACGIYLLLFPQSGMSLCRSRHPPPLYFFEETDFPICLAFCS